MAQQEFKWTDALAGEFVIFQQRNQHLYLPDAIAAFKEGNTHKPLFTTNDGVDIFTGDTFYSVTPLRCAKHMAYPGSQKYDATFADYLTANDFYNKLLNSKQSFEEVVKPVIKWLNENHNPHTKVLVGNNGAELIKGIHGINTDEFIKP